MLLSFLSECRNQLLCPVYRATAIHFTRRANSEVSLVNHSISLDKKHCQSQFQIEQLNCNLINQ